MPDDTAVSLDHVSKTYGNGDGAVHALADASLDVAPGTFTAVMGPSGSGKSTLLRCAAGLERVDGGRVRIGTTELGGLDDDRLARLRRERLGFVFQQYNLVDALDAGANVELQLRLAGRTADPGWRATVLEACGLSGALLRRRPAALSGGQQQRVAIARAVVGRPQVVFADEPTGALDRRSAGQVVELLARCVQELGQTVVMVVTHDPVSASACGRVVLLADGRIAGDHAGGPPEHIARLLTELDAVAR